MKMNLSRTFGGIAGRSIAASMLSGAMLMASSAWGMSGASLSGPGILSAGTHDIYYRGEVIADAGLEELRGGFSLAGMEMSFGAKLTTLINNALRYETEVTFTRNGAEVLSRTLTDRLGSMGTATLVGPDQAVGAADISGNLDLGGLADFSGVVVDYGEGGGMIAALHQITRRAIISTLATDASGQSVNNNVDVSIHINNIDEIRAARQRTMILNSLNGAPR